MWSRIMGCGMVAQLQLEATPGSFRACHRTDMKLAAKLRWQLATLEGHFRHQAHKAYTNLYSTVGRRSSSKGVPAEARKLPGVASKWPSQLGLYRHALGWL